MTYSFITYPKITYKILHAFVAGVLLLLGMAIFGFANSSWGEIAGSILLLISSVAAYFILRSFLGISTIATIENDQVFVKVEDKEQTTLSYAFKIQEIKHIGPMMINSEVEIHLVDGTIIDLYGGFFMDTGMESFLSHLFREFNKAQKPAVTL
ncbi:MAG: hypothetical protein U0V74_10335 [Chitinophagales bacterium]